LKIKEIKKVIGREDKREIGMICLTYGDHSIKNEIFDQKYLSFYVSIKIFDNDI